MKDLVYWLSYCLMLTWVAGASGWIYLAISNMRIRTRVSGAFLALFVCFFISAFKIYDAYYIHNIEIKHYDLFILSWAAGLAGLYSAYRFIWVSNVYGFR